MSAAPQIKGWCPGALRPMQSGDGWIVRVRPFLGRFSAEQAAGLANLSATYGNGLLDISARGNLQLRGLQDVDHRHVVDALRVLGLVDANLDAESRRNILVTPFWQKGDLTHSLAKTLTLALSRSNAPALPGKFGFAIDTGPAPVLQSASADIRLERNATGAVILTGQGLERGKIVSDENAIPAAMDLARWFIAKRTTENRMSDLIKRLKPEGFDVPRHNSSFIPSPGPLPHGVLAGIAFGQFGADTLARLAQYGSLRMTPWRMVLIEGASEVPPIDGIIFDPADPLLRVVACIGAPRCAQGLGETRDLARTLARSVGQGSLLHVSGCTKGCAHPKPASLTVVATHTGYDIIENGTAAGVPSRSGLSKQSLTKAI